MPANLPQDERADVLSVLQRIGRTRYGDGQDWTDEERIRYWSKMALEYRGLARDLHARLGASVPSHDMPTAYARSENVSTKSENLDTSGPSPMQPGLNAKAPVSSRGGSGFNAGGVGEEATDGRSGLAERDEEDDANEELVHRLRGLAEAYPIDIFPEPKREDMKWLQETKPGLIDRISAAMGRHLSQFFAQAADALSRASAGPDPDTQGGAAEMREPTAECIEKIARVLDPVAWASELPVPTRADTIAWHEGRAKSCELARRVLAALALPLAFDPDGAEEPR